MEQNISLIRTRTAERAAFFENRAELGRRDSDVEELIISTPLVDFFGRLLYIYVKKLFSLYTV